MDDTLSFANIEFLKREIGKSGLTYSHLLDELIDHVCCDVEYEMANGLPFAKAYERVKAKIGIGGLERIQHETLYLIDKKYRIMKNTMKISGVIAPILLAFGSLFRIQHWPAASILLVLGFFLLSFVFLPSAVYVSYKEVSNNSRKWTHLMGFLGTFVLSIGFLFKVQHWPGASVALTLGIVIICLVFLPMVAINRNRDNQPYVPKYVYATALLGMMLFLIGFLCKMLHWPGAAIFMLAGSVLLILLAFPVYVFKAYKEESHVSNSFIFIVIVLVWFVVPTTLISTNVSRNVLNSVYETNRSIDMDLNYIETSNDELFNQMKEDSKAIAVKNSTNEILDYIQSIKADMVKLAGNNETITPGNEIVLNELSGVSNVGTYNMVLFNAENKAARLRELLQKFEQEMMAVSTESEYTSIIQRTLVYKIEPEDNQRDILLMSLNKLSFLELNICLAERTALRQLQQYAQAPVDLLSTMNN